MNKTLPVALFAWGVVLIVFGVKAAQSFGSDAPRLFAGSPKDNAAWMLIAGVAAISIGLFSALRRSK